MWMGETPKNVAAVFRLARQEQAVLFFDEADAIASRRSTSVDHGFQRESNTVVNVLLQELERFNGVVIFATNLAANFDPAFERRIRTHVLFEMPGVDEREQIWRVQMHPTLTPLADDVDFRKLAETYEVSGGDIRNAVLKAALAAATTPQHDTLKLIHQHHFDEGIRDVIAGKKVMKQSLFDKSPAEARRQLLDGSPQGGQYRTCRVRECAARCAGRSTAGTVSLIFDAEAQRKFTVTLILAPEHRLRGPQMPPARSRCDALRRCAAAPLRRDGHLRSRSRTSAGTRPAPFSWPTRR